MLTFEPIYCYPIPKYILLHLNWLFEICSCLKMQPNAVVMTKPVYSTVDDTNPRYRCCCGCMSVVTGAIIIGILEILGALSNIGGLIAQQVQGNTNGLQGSIYYGIVGAGITIILVVLLFVGIGKEHHAFVLPHLIFQIIGIILMIIGGIFLVITVLCVGIVVSQNGNDSYVAGFTWGIILFAVIALFLAAIFEIWFFVVILKLYRYYKEKRLSSFTSVAQYSYQQQQQQPLGPQPAYSNPGTHPAYNHAGPHPAYNSQGYQQAYGHPGQGYTKYQ